MYYNNYNFPEYRAMEIDNQRAPETVTNADNLLNESIPHLPLTIA